ncbi:MAG TPA: large conductance mechanosensitive channel protein MscL [Pyrinomonadaceae bacterium]|jgi:large conductance mechanosensitive channel
MWEDFKAFIFRGNVIDLAVAVIIGAAFTRIATTLSEGIISPFLGLITGGIDFKSKFFVLSGQVPTSATPEAIDAAVKAGTLNIVRYGQLLNDIINFLIVGAVLFLIVRWFSKYLKFMAATAAPTPTETLLTEIRDILASKPNV